MTGIKSLWTSVGIAAFGMLTGSGVWGGTVISTNLPANTQIVNVNATTDGCGTFGSGGTSDSQSYWYQPNAGAATTSITLAPGTYRFRVISPADAATQFPALTTAQRNQMYTAWTYNTPWTTNYMAFRSTALTNGSESQIFDGGSVPTGVAYNTSNATTAYNSLIASGYDDNIRLAPPGRSGTTAADFASTSYTFTTTTTVLFAVPDTTGGLGDNAGGVSIVVTPEPGSLVLAAVSASLLLVRRRRNRC